MRKFTSALLIIIAVVQSIALGQTPDPFLAQQTSWSTVVPNLPPTIGAIAPVSVQNPAVQHPAPEGADAGQPVDGSTQLAKGGGYQRYRGPEETAPPVEAPPPPAKPAEKKEGEKSEEAEKKGAEGEKKEENAGPQNFNFHAQTTAIAQGDPGFPVQYSGPNSLNNVGERQGTLVVDLFAGLRVWRGGEVHGDFLMWQGYGLSNTFGIEDFPNGDGYKAGTSIPNFSAAHLFVRQTFGLGGEQEDVPDGPLTLAGKQDISRLTFTVGRMSVTDIFDNNTYAHDQHTQFMNWAAITNVTWDYAADPVGYTTGITVEFNQPDWTLRYGFFQMPSVQNGFTADDRIFTWPGSGADGPFFLSWAMMTELERRWKIDGHPGAIRFLAWLNEANMASYSEATAILLANPPDPNAPAGGNAPAAAQAYRCKYGFGLNWEQEVAKNVGMFSRVGWNDGQEDAWTFTDATWSVSLGVSVKGPLQNLPKRQNDTFGLLGIISGTSHANQEFLQAGGTGILDGDGALSYSPEKALETYYKFQLNESTSLTMDYQFVSDPSFNSARGPVSIFGARLHWEY